MPAPKRVKGFSKKAVKSLIKSRKTPAVKRYGKAVMKDDPSKPGRKVGYATTTTTTLPGYKPKKRTTKVARKANKKARKR